MRLESYKEFTDSLCLSKLRRYGTFDRSNSWADINCKMIILGETSLLLSHSIDPFQTAFTSLALINPIFNLILFQRNVLEKLQLVQ